MEKLSGKIMLIWAKNHQDMKFLRKNLSFTLENLTGKLILTVFLLFSRVPEALGEFFPFSFCGLGGRGFSGWCGIQADWGRVPVPPCPGLAGR